MVFEKTESKKPGWDPELYDGKHSFVWKYGSNLVDLLDPLPGEKILDLGCGTGHLTSTIKEKGAEVVGIDFSPEMIDQARTLYPGIEFRVAEGTKFKFDDPFEAVFSNAALHWMKKPEKVIARVWDALRPGGRFVAEMGGKGNVSNILSAL